MPVGFAPCSARGQNGRAARACLAGCVEHGGKPVCDLQGLALGGLSGQHHQRRAGRGRRHHRGLLLREQYSAILIGVGATPVFTFTLKLIMRVSCFGADDLFGIEATNDVTYSIPSKTSQV